MIVSVQREDFSVDQVTRELCGERRDIGAVVSFTGLVRDLTQHADLCALQLEHYPGMTERALESIATEACQRWDIEDVAIIHRVGKLLTQQNIVLVVTLSAHRKQAFEAAEFIMDYLKTRAPFWKKEITLDGEHWVEAHDADQDAAKRWNGNDKQN